MIKNISSGLVYIPDKKDVYEDHFIGFEDIEDMIPTDEKYYYKFEGIINECPEQDIVDNNGLVYYNYKIIVRLGDCLYDNYKINKEYKKITETIF